MLGPYTHRIDPVLADFAGIYLWFVMLIRSRLRRLGRFGAHPPAPAHPRGSVETAPLLGQRVAFVCVLTLSLTIPSNWTQDVSSRYGLRHDGGIRPSSLYPCIDTAPATGCR
jgi:hypothetical protein